MPPGVAPCPHRPQGANDDLWSQSLGEGHTRGRARAWEAKRKAQQPPRAPQSLLWAEAVRLDAPWFAWPAPVKASRDLPLGLQRAAETSWVLKIGFSWKLCGSVTRSAVPSLRREARLRSGSLPIAVAPLVRRPSFRMNARAPRHDGRSRAPPPASVLTAAARGSLATWTGTPARPATSFFLKVVLALPPPTCSPHTRVWLCRCCCWNPYPRVRDHETGAPAWLSR
ncbi:uncharacterized protein LOC103675257 isoform X1 [Ursus maritimus]|uniref:Uncharacterized protein LOC103675257 isoform X1 n=1 Tax=Ursus maritimus TaxID=29073 RepID=A0A384D6U7_URSMA|nr:uncharacterized protein LOC103675257 isoform X1 [Ursus maritimus]